MMIRKVLQIRVLGQFDVRCDDRAIGISSRPAQSLFAYLAMNAGLTHRREKLAGLLWPDSTESNARTYLRQALWRVRKAMETAGISCETYLEVDDLALRFPAEAPYSLDAAVLLELSPSGGWSVEELQAAVSAYRGEFLPGFYDEWTVVERERLLAAFDRKMRLLTDHLQAQQRWNDVLVWAERWVSLSRVPEPAYVAMMTAHAGLDDIPAMHMTYERLAEALDRELGMAPSDEVCSLRERLGHGTPPLLVPTVPLVETEAWSCAPSGLAPTTGLPPYKGLAFYNVEDTDLYFGRERLVGDLVDRLHTYPPLLIIVGASGSGKSSLLRAGLVPAIMRGPEGQRWAVRILDPTAHPLQALAIALVGQDGANETLAMEKPLEEDLGIRRAVEALLEREGASRMLLVVDQFEELFTLCRDEQERSAFVDALVQGIDPSIDGVLSVVIALRADFYDRCADFPALRDALSDHQVYVGAMTPQELRRAIEEPAARGGWTFEPGLVDLILHDVRNEPGALSLLSHALLETWQRRTGCMLTLAGYAEAGGVRGAVTRTAEAFYNRRLSPLQQGIARAIFLRLTEPGEDGPPTRRRVARHELALSGVAPAEVTHVLDLLSDARLVTLGIETVEVTHEALIREWPTLRRWLAEDREGLRIHHHLTEAAQAWEALDRDPGALYRGTRLVQAEFWAQSHAMTLNPLEYEFLEAAVAQRTGEVAEHQAQQERDIEAARRAAEAERARAEAHAQYGHRLRWLVLGLSCALLMAVLAVGLAIEQRSRAERQAHLARARELAAASVSALTVDPELSILLALRAVSETTASDLPAVPEAVESLHKAVITSRLRAVFTGQGQEVTDLALSPDGKWLGVAGRGGAVYVWDVKTGQALRVLSSGAFHAITAVAFDPQGTMVASVDDRGTITIWDWAEGHPLETMQGSSSVRALVFSPSGTLVAFLRYGESVHIWDVVTGQIVAEVGDSAQQLVDLAFSPDGTMLAVASLRDGVSLWDMATRARLATIAGAAGDITRIALSPDGDRMVTAGLDGTARIWRLDRPGSAGEQLALHGHQGAILSIAFSSDGQCIATGGIDRKARVWDAQTGQGLLTLAGHRSDVARVAFAPDGDLLYTASGDGTVRAWNLGLNAEYATLAVPDGVFRFAFSPSGDVIAAGVGETGTVWVWDVRTKGQSRVLATGHRARVSSLAFSADGRWVATASDDATARVLRADTGETSIVLEGHSDWVNDIAFSADSLLVVTASRDQTASLWSVPTGPRVRTLVPRNADVVAVAFPLLADPTTYSTVTATTNGIAADLLVIGSTAGVDIWRADGSRQLLALRVGPGVVNDVAINPDGTAIAAALGDGTVQVWSLDREAGGELRVASERFLTGHAAQVVGIAFSPDGAQLATASMDGTARIWEVATGSSLLSLHVADDTWLSSVAFSPDGRLLAVSSGHGIHLYLTHLDDLASLARSRLTRGFAVEECARYLREEACPVLEEGVTVPASAP